MAFALVNGYGFYLTTTLALITTALLIKLCCIPQPNKPQGSYECPGVPVVPCLGILGNFILCSGISLFSWLAFLVYLSIGLVFYLVYG